jgi:CheY-like chemotaxis protein
MFKVLVVDDARPVRLMATLILSRLTEATLVEASDGREGIALARRERPDVILLDVNMPGLSGPETLAALRSDPATRAIPVIFFTAEESGREIQRLLALGASGVVHKPFDPRSLVTQFNACLAAAA